jgi:hypothetical protein
MKNYIYFRASQAKNFRTKVAEKTETHNLYRNVFRKFCGFLNYKRKVSSMLSSQNSKTVGVILIKFYIGGICPLRLFHAIYKDVIHKYKIQRK